jgi:hypothetical protein
LLPRMCTYIRLICPPALEGTWRCSRNGVHYRFVSFSEPAYDMFLSFLIEYVKEAKVDVQIEWKNTSPKEAMIASLAIHLRAGEQQDDSLPSK